MEAESAVPGLDWTERSSADPALFDQLRALGPARIHVRLTIGVDGPQVQVPAASITVQGSLTIAPGVDRFGVSLPGTTAGDYAWFSRRKGRGRTDYWQIAIQQHAEGRPALVLYFTAELDGLLLRTAPQAATAGAFPRGGEPEARVGTEPSCS